MHKRQIIYYALCPIPDAEFVRSIIIDLTAAANKRPQTVDPRGERVMLSILDQFCRRRDGQDHCVAYMPPRSLREHILYCASLLAKLEGLAHVIMNEDDRNWTAMRSLPGCLE